MTFQHNSKLLIPIGLVVALIMGTATVVYQFGFARSDLADLKLDVVRVEAEFIPRSEHNVEIGALRASANDRHAQLIRELDEIKMILREIQSAR